MLENPFFSAAQPPSPVPPLFNSWQQVHQLLLQSESSHPSFAGLTIYHHCVHHAFATKQDLLHARNLFEKLVIGSEQLLHNPWTTPRFDQVCALAWLHTQPTTLSLEGTRVANLLNHFDEVLATHATTLLGDSASTSRQDLLHTLRYLSLRLPVAGAQRHLRALLCRYTQKPVLRATTGSWSLGLVNGLASELLLLLRLQHISGVEADIRNYVREGVVALLALRRDVDFSDQRFSVFPEELAGIKQDRIFSDALSWQCGDLGQVLLLYEAQKVIQDMELAKVADLVGLNTLLRSTTPTTPIAKVTSSHFYKGAAGVAHLYQKLYQVSGHRAYRTAYDFWTAQTQYWLQQEFANVITHQDEGHLFSGLIGVGLVLLSATTGKHQQWDTLIV